MSVSRKLLIVMALVSVFAVLGGADSRAQFDPNGGWCDPSACSCQCTLQNDECLRNCQESGMGACDLVCCPSYESCMAGC